MTAVTYPPATPFAVTEDHPNRTAHQWLSTQLDCLDWAHVRSWRIGREADPLLALKQAKVPRPPGELRSFF